MSGRVRKILPYPFVTFALFATWLLFQQSMSAGHVLLGAVIGVAGARTLLLLDMPKGPVRRGLAAGRLFALIVRDIVISNLTVSALILRPQGERGAADFITFQLDVRSPYALTVLALAMTAAPGTLWVRYDATDSTLLIHMLDTLGKEAWIENIKGRYEPLLREVFE